MISLDQIKVSTDVSRLGTILSVWAHPDDESFLAAGVLAAAVKNGQQVICVTATRGEKGMQDESRWPAARLGDIRERELKAALQELGITRHHWLYYSDGECAQAPSEEATQKIVTLAEQYQPDSILTFDPEGLTGHPDHQAVSQWVDIAVTRVQKKPAVYHAVYNPEQYERYLRPLSNRLDIFFAIDKPPLVPADKCAIALELTDELLSQKWRALEVMPSQMERLLKLVPPAARRGTFGREYFVLSKLV